MESEESPMADFITIKVNKKDYERMEAELSRLTLSAAESQREAERLRLGIKKALTTPEARAYILEHTLKNGADNCCEGRCQGHGTAEAVRHE